MAVATWRSNLKPVGDPLRNKSLRGKSSSSLESPRNGLLKTWPKKATEASLLRETEKKTPTALQPVRKFNSFRSNSLKLESATSHDSPKNALSKTWLEKTNEASNLKETKKKSPTSRWSHLSASTSFSRSKPQGKDMKQKKNSGGRITAAELLAREFSPAEKAVASPRQRSSLFLRKIEMFEGEVPGKLLNGNDKAEDTQLKIANEKLDFCSNEMVDMKKFIGQIEEDFLQIRELIEKTRGNMKDLKIVNQSDNLTSAE